ncbi:MAG: helix-turn-helix domain-containing protein, partial [Saprospiraceae bacterium]|nr:helix-turn-helix domain-containing protein [Saprospiraceae bacterium]
LTDNKSVKKVVQEALEELQKDVFSKNACFAKLQNGFSATQYLRSLADAELDFKAAKPSATSPTGAPKNVPHPVLYNRLKKWREDTAEIHNVELYAVMRTKSLLEIVETLPLNLSMLKKIKGIGSVKIQQFGPELITIVQQYCSEFNVPTEQLLELAAEALAADKPKVDTKIQSFELFKAGKTIDEIAAERNFVRSTIEGHLAHFIGTGELDIFSIMERPEVEEIEAFFRGQEAIALSAAKAHFEDKYSYAQLKMVVEYMGM